MNRPQQPAVPRVIRASAAPALYVALKALLESEYPVGGDDGIASDLPCFKLVLAGYHALLLAEGRLL